MGVETILRASRLGATPAMTDDNHLSFSLPSVSRKKVTAAFDGGRLSSDSGVMLLALAETPTQSRRHACRFDCPQTQSFALRSRGCVANNPLFAMTALLHKLCLNTFQREMPHGCLLVSVRPVFFSAQAQDLKESPSAKSIDERHKAWRVAEILQRAEAQ